MDNDLELEELALRRRLLFRLLRGHRFDRPDFRTEAIADIVPKGLIAPDRSLFGTPDKPGRTAG
ncbi:hypothetical protein K3553_07720 [Leisingera aquaemixtae]|uniref:hypothetical protein n=1 Tax=Leisingera aquaemixtae TaxID=1396826 RepID=UPI0021A869DA|nr:hypothetical protein [Leisingera aquaemixtae]UWQ26343.1 hypothetical protein K3553_07720 [Leisingera aquaemixtae]